MSLLPFHDADGMPLPGAAFLNAVLCSALYHGDRSAFDQAATLLGGQVVFFETDPTTFVPDCGIIQCGSQFLIIFDGTTNIPQVISYCTGAIIPNPDTLVPTSTFPALCNQGFLLGMSKRAPSIDPILASVSAPQVYLAGHSYGAAAAFVYGRQLANRSPAPQPVEIMTFGEPRAYDARDALHEPGYHARLIAQDDIAPNFIEVQQPIDPVTAVPPAIIQFGKIGTVARVVKSVIGVNWTHHGTPWMLRSNFIGAGQPTPFIARFIPSAEITVVLSNISHTDLHLMDTSYLTRILAWWQKSGSDPELAPMVPFANRYIADPTHATQFLGPPATADSINQAYFADGDAPVTDSNRSDWSTISAVADQFFPVYGGEGKMTLMRGSFLCHVMKQGFSETWHSSNPSDTYQSMQTKLAAILPFRAKLTNTTTQTGEVGNPNNLVSFDFFRISDDLLVRDVFPATTATPIGWNGTAGNADGQQVTKVIWRNAGGAQIAVSYLHGIPIGGLTVNAQPDRYAVYSGTYKTILQAYCNQVAAQGLGFHTINNNPTNAMGQIMQVTYNAVSGNYSFQMQNAVPQGRFRVSLRGFKSLRFLNGRQSAQATGSNTFVVIKPGSNIAWDNFGTAVPLEGYNNFVRFSNYIVVVPATATPSITTTKKLGRPFFLQHGRLTRRPAA